MLCRMLSATKAMRESESDTHDNDERGGGLFFARSANDSAGATNDLPQAV